VTNTNRWLDDLPEDAPERQLLVAGRAVRSPAGSLERGWQALSVGLGAASATAVVSTQAAATTVAAKIAFGCAGLSLGAKAIAIGFAVGMGAVGVIQVSEHVSHRPSAQTLSASRPSVMSKGESAPTRPRPTVGPAEAPVMTAGVDPVAIGAHAPSAPAAVLSLSDQRKPSAKQASATATSSIAAVAEPEAKESPLAEQAQELAQVKRLVDAGAVEEALRRLKSSFLHDVNSALSEEREALYIEALSKAQHADEAKRRAQRFLVRYPNSPHLEKMRRLVAGR
jgi:hypothetical protein